MAEDYEDAVLLFGSRRYPGGGLRLSDPEVYDAACKMLLAGYAVARVAVLVGYTHRSSFSRAWLLRTGERPGAWREAQGAKVRRGPSRRGTPHKRATWTAADLRPSKRKAKKRKAKGPRVDMI